MPRPGVRSRRCSRASSVEGASDGDQAAAVAARELALGGQAVARRPLARIEGGPQVKIDLVVQRDGPSSSRKRAIDSLGVLRRPGLRSPRIADNVISNVKARWAWARSIGHLGPASWRGRDEWASSSRSWVAAAPTRRS